jgi:hypothetical protein
VTFTQSRSSSLTTTWARVKHVTRKVQADLLGILDLYGYYSEEYGLKLIRDLRVLLDEEVIDRLAFVWVKKGTNEVLYSLAYTVIGGDVLPDHDTGDIPYYSELAATVASFSVVIYRSQRWKSMAEYSKNRVREKLELGWEGDVAHNYPLGWWVVDRTYSKSGYGLERKHFVRA